MSVIVEAVMAGCRYLYRTVLWNPAKSLYLLGPAIGSIGFWKGTRLEEICSQMTGTPSDLWLKNTEECGNLIDRNVTSLVVGIQAVLYVGILWHLACYAWYRIFILPAFFKGMKKIDY